MQPPDAEATLELNPAFGGLFARSERRLLAAWVGAMVLVRVRKGDVLVAPDAVLDGVILVPAGVSLVAVWKLGVLQNRVHTMGDVVGCHGVDGRHRDLLHQLSAQTDGWVFTISNEALGRLRGIDTRGGLRGVLGDILHGSAEFDVIADRLTEQESLKLSSVFQHMTVGDRAKLVEQSRWIDYATNEVILLGGSEPDGYHLIDVGGRVGVVESTQRWGDVPFELGVGDVVGATDVLPPKGSPGRNPSRAVALCPMRTLYLSNRSLRKVAGADDNATLTTLLQERALVEANTELIVSGMASDLVLGDMSPTMLYPALQIGWARLWRGGGHPPAPVGDRSGFHVVVTGELLTYMTARIPEISALSDQEERFLTLAVARPGDACGVIELAVGLEVIDRWCTRGPTWTIWFPWELFLRMYGDTLCFEDGCNRVKALAEGVLELREAVLTRALLPIAEHVVQRPLIDPDPSPPTPTRMQVFLPVPGTRWTPTLERLFIAVGRQIVADYDEATIVAKLVPLGTPVPRAVVDGPFVQVVLPVDDSPEAMVNALLDLTETYADLRPSHVLTWAAPDLSNAWLLGSALDGAQYINTNPTTREGDPAPLPEHMPMTSPLAFTAFLPPGGVVMSHGQEYPPSTVRLGIDLVYLENHPEELHRFPDDMARWGRAITDRLVGVALGGGGAWGFAHVAVLRGMQQNGVPIDMVSGASFGSVVGAFFCARGDEGLQFLLDNGQELQAVVTTSGLTAVILQEWVDKQLDGVRLESMVVPFLPVCGDITTASLIAVRTGSVGFGVRASSSFVPVFPSSPSGGEELVDGGFVSNVPTWLLGPQGGNLVVASNIVPTPALRRVRTPLIGGKVGQVISDLNLLARLPATLDAGLTLFNSVGDLESSNVPVYFDQTWSNNWFFQFADGTRIVRDALAVPAFQETLAGLSHRWDALKLPKRPPAP
ncbi:MAG: putative acylesterase/phospholipase RssA [Myxococcota bacterium]|jgi:predicted acylesterase/phospholipase RssA